MEPAPVALAAARALEGSRFRFAIAQNLNLCYKGHNMRSPIQFLREEEKAIVTAAAILSVVVGLFGFGMTIQQLRRAETTLRASNTYQVQKDGRELLQDVNKEASFQAFMESAGETDFDYPTSYNFWRVYNFYLVVYRQAKAGGLSKDFVRSYRVDFCGFVRRQAPARGWTELLAKNRIENQHVAMRRDWCKDA
jgi:hypothetical protein